MGKAFAKGVVSCMFASICDTITGAVVHALSMTCSMHACLSQRDIMHTGSHIDTCNAVMQSRMLKSSVCHNTVAKL